MNVSDFDFDLPEELIAQHPLVQRDASRLMVLHRDTQSIEHRRFQDLQHFLQPGDVLVVNNTRVIPARLLGKKTETGAHMEILLLKRLQRDIWEVLIKPAKRLQLGQTVDFGEGHLQGELVDILADGNRVMRFSYDGVFEEVLDRLGQMPLPPYIVETLADTERYQTVYAKERGSAAAPTAGLHFTPELLQALEKQGIEVLEILLHVGLGTFRPVKVENIEEHVMHSEYYRLDEKTAARINQAKLEKRRVIAVGTTVTRTLETIAAENGRIRAAEGWTDIFIYPGYRFKVIDGLITNFHFPKSTLIMLVSALAGRKFVLQAYNEAVTLKYRFFSFGDAMLIL